LVALLGLIPGAIASKKGRSFALWWFFGAMLFIVALPMAILMKPADVGAGRSSSSKQRPDTHVPGWLVVVALAGVGIFIYMQVNSGGGSVGPQPVITMSKYHQIQNGMSYQQVVQIIGNPGQEISRNHIAGVPGVMESVDTVMYQWANPRGSNMNAMFQNDKLVQKAQFGLK
jgi:hypothetical protein